MAVEEVNKKKNLKLADELFAAGKFPESEVIFQHWIAQDATNPALCFRLGHIALLANRLSEARQWFAQISEAAPEFTYVPTFLAEIAYREDDFAQAAAHFAKVGRHAMAAKLAAFGHSIPYLISNTGSIPHGVSQASEKNRFHGVITLPFIVSEPLPIVRVSVNGLAANFLIDTGTDEVVLDSDFAQDAGAVPGEFERSMFAGGKHGILQHGRVDSIHLGNVEIGNVPVQMGEIRSLLAPYFDGMPVEGIIGAALFYHFCATIDYPQSRLILRSKQVNGAKSGAPEGAVVFESSGENAGPERIDPEKVVSKNIVKVPFWLAENHHIIAWGSMNGHYPVLMFVDTGQAGFSFAAPLSTVQNADLTLCQEETSQAQGGGGWVSVTPFNLAQLNLGAASITHTRGVLTPQFPLEHRFGFRIGGLLAHDFFKSYALTLDFTHMHCLLELNRSI